jgi:hypothetical protein
LPDSISEQTIDYVFNSSEFGADAIKAFQDIQDYILSKPILQRANIKKRFYLKTNFSTLGLGFALCQPDNSELIAAMNREDAGGSCKSELCVSKMRLLPVAFGSRKTKGNEVHFYSHPGESLAASRGTTKNCNFLWGRPFTLITDCRALVWLMDYKGHDHAVRRLQLKMLGYNFILEDYLSIAREAYVNQPPSTDPLGDQNMPGRRAKRATPSDEEQVIGFNLANVKWSQDSIDLTPTSNKFACHYSNIPVHICETKVMQTSSKNTSSTSPRRQCAPVRSSGL